MIKVNIDYKKGIFEVKGHANYNAKGYDIVCSSVSVLARNIYLFLEHISSAEQELFKDSEELEVMTKTLEYKDGHIKCKFDNQNISIVFFLTHHEKIFAELRDDYPQYISFKTVYSK
ncbi:MAG: ribosomal-processing cysteine protease Prp [bacterium]